MNVVMVGVSVVGVVVMLVGYLTRHTGGRFFLLSGAPLVVGPMSNHLEGYVPDSVRILFSFGAIALALAGFVAGVVEVRRRGARPTP